jgi:hypothetical protein
MSIIFGVSNAGITPTTTTSGSLAHKQDRNKESMFVIQQDW